MKWTKENTDYLLNNAKEISAIEISLQLNCTKKAIERKCAVLGISYRLNFSEEITCLTCGKTFKERKCEKRKFCTQSCAAKYHNTHKKYGTRRSKLEKYLEEQLILLYPDLEIHFNRKDTINSELDIFIPSLNLAFELNGIFHYEPIFGKDKHIKTVDNDDLKFKKCIDNNINLCVLDVSSQKRFTIESSQQYLNIITDIINKE